MPYCEMNLDIFVNKSKDLSIDMIKNYFTGIINSLEFMHNAFGEKSKVHGNIRPSNIFVDHTTAKIGDIFHSQLLLSRPVHDFLSPEVKSSNQPDKKSDIYSIGCILYYICTKTTPIIQIININGIYQPFTEIINQMIQEDKKKRPKLSKIKSDIYKITEIVNPPTQTNYISTYSNNYQTPISNQYQPFPTQFQSQPSPSYNPPIPTEASSYTPNSIPKEPYPTIQSIINSAPAYPYSYESPSALKRKNDQVSDNTPFKRINSNSNNSVLDLGSYGFCILYIFSNKYD